MTEWAGESITDNWLPERLAEQYVNMAFEPYLTRSGYAFESYGDWLRLADSAVSICNRMIDELRKRGDDELASLELASAKKIRTNWRYPGRGGLALEDEIHVSNPSQAEELRTGLRIQGLNIAAAVDDLPTAEIESVMANAEVPINKGKGYPWWTRGTDREAAIALARLAFVSDRLDDITNATIEGSDARIEPLITSYWRLAGSKDKRSVIKEAGGVLEVSDEMDWFASVRRVQAVPWYLNLRFTPFAQLLKHVRGQANDGRGSGRPETVIERMSGYPYAISADMSTYDQHFGAELLELARDLLYEPTLRILRMRGIYSAKECDLVRQIAATYDSMPILSPPVRRQEYARLYRRVGTLSSGRRDTSELGTNVNFVYNKHKLGQMRALSYTDYDCLGDDIIVFSKHDIEEEWRQVGGIAGFDETIEPGSSFLKRRMPAGHGLVASMIDGTIMKEVPNEPAKDAIAALGIKARRQVLQGIRSSHPMAGVYDDWLNSVSGRLVLARTIANGTELTALSESAGREARTDEELEQIEQALALYQIEGLDAKTVVKSSLLERSKVRYSELQHDCLGISVTQARTLLMERRDAA
jgi:hypothetical protein